MQCLEIHDKSAGTAQTITFELDLARDEIAGALLPTYAVTLDSPNSAALIQAVSQSPVRPVVPNANPPAN